MTHNFNNLIYISVYIKRSFVFVIHLLNVVKFTNFIHNICIRSEHNQNISFCLTFWKYFF